jgi:DNA modification methylase
MDTYHEDSQITLYHGDALEVARTLPSGSIDCICCSPPYFHLRDFGVEGQYGQEATPAEYVETLRALFTELWRVLSPTGTCWLVLGDTYQKNKNLLLIPHRVAIALQDDGWILRNDIVWAKNAMPESVTDRLACRREDIFLLVKQATYWFDLDAIREPHTASSIARQEASRKRRSNVTKGLANQGDFSKGLRELNPRGANPGDVWNIPTEGFPGMHHATFPVQLAQRCIAAGCKPSGIVLDPFHGSGTTGYAALRDGHHYIGVDISAEYLKMSMETRLFQPSLDFEVIDERTQLDTNEPELPAAEAREFLTLDFGAAGRSPR